MNDSPVMTPANAARPTVGAIRWDAWTGGKVTLEVERSLGPERYHHRMPWFGQVINEETVRIDGSEPVIMEQEIAWAAEAGLDYWAFLLYPEASPMSVALHQYLASPKRQQVKFCLILHNAFGVPEAQWPAERDRAVALLQNPCYQSVLDGRPLVYTFSLSYQGAFPAARISEFLTAAKAAGCRPYMVYMGWHPAKDYPMVAPWGFDAVSAYASCSAVPTFAELTRQTETQYWANAAQAQAPYVPLVTSGWEKQPRKDHPVSWEKGHSYHQQATFPALPQPDELADHLRRALAFTRQQAAICEAQTVICYAWNEYDEGGWLAPTWQADGAPNRSRLAAVEKVLRPTA